MPIRRTGRRLDCRRLGRIDYPAALALQERLRLERAAEAIGDTALFLEHPPTVTLGTRGVDADLIDPTTLERRGVAVCRTNRGGQTTFHGPGQLVVYLIVNLYSAQRELRLFVETLERAVITCLDRQWGLKGHVDPAHPGVWVGDEKVAALGIAVKDRVTYHGLALNLTTDLSHFAAIVPCGIRDRGVCSVASLLGRGVDFAAAEEALAAALAEAYGYDGFDWNG